MRSNTQESEYPLFRGLVGAERVVVRCWATKLLQDVPVDPDSEDERLTAALVRARREWDEVVGQWPAAERQEFAARLVERLRQHPVWGLVLRAGTQ